MSTPTGQPPVPATEPLLDAIVAVASELDLPVVLRRIAEAARSLVDASYAALGVLDETGEELAEFLFVGMETGRAEQIGALPRGRGVLGELIRDPHPLRLDQLSDSPASFGFPPGHPPMRTFLGVPVRVRDQVFGNLYLTDKRGGAPFDERDSAVLEALAAAAGVAISNARLYADSRARESWQHAASEVSTALLSGDEPEQVLALVARRVRELTGAGTAVVALPLPGGDLLVEACDGDGLGADGEGLLGRRLAGQGQLAQTLGAHTAVPLGEPGAPQGVIALVGLSVAPTGGQLDRLEGFARQTAVALELADRRRDEERFAVHNDRDRIARDLHDLVIQRLFATGMALESATRLIPERPRDAVVRVQRAVDELDTTIHELRSTIYGLQAPMDEAPSLRALLLRVIDGATVQLGFAPSLRLSGLLDTAVAPTAAEHLLAAVREALSNVARHARASRVDVVVSVREGTLVLQVNDDGVGLPPVRRNSGLANLGSRAEELGGELVVTSVPQEGTRFTWRVPMPAG